MKFLTLLLLFAALALGASEPNKPVLLLGQSYDAKSVVDMVLKPAGIKYEIAPNGWLAPENYGKYSAVYYGLELKKRPDAGWKSAAEVAALKKYVENGGTLIIGGNALYNICGKGRDLSPLADIIGYKWYNTLKTKDYKTVTIKADFAKSAKLAGTAFNWVTFNEPSKLTTAEVLAEFTGDGAPAKPAILVNRVGKGKVYTVCQTLQALRRNIKVTGIADDKGNFILNEDGKRLNALIAVYKHLFLSAANVAAEKLSSSDWGRTPLGAPGKLRLKSISTRAPEFQKAPPLKNAMLLAENGEAKALICGSEKALVNELKRHLDKMTGADFKVVSAVPNDSPAIVVSRDSTLPPETIIVKTSPSRILISGSEPRMGLFYFLEKLGCRFLWPGESGKVIPRVATLYAPEIDLNTVPVLQRRGIRNPLPGGGRTPWGLKACGITDNAAQEEYCRNYRSAVNYQPGNSTIWQWHGMGGRANFRWGHAFGHFYKKHGKTQPELFALQPNGSRSQDASPDRPRLCLGNPATSEVIAREVKEFFASNPSANSQTICLNDGGATSFCMCVMCRKLDPANAVPIKMLFNINGMSQDIPYVSLTDRVLDFSNRIAEKTAAAFPGKYLGVYLYSYYASLPVSVTPHKSLLFCITEQSYISDRHRQQALEDYGKWRNFGNLLFFRPNALWGHFRIIAPQNYARKMFNDLEFYKANGLAGTDFDCCEQQWAGKGLIYYALLKAHWNPDRLSYDDIFDDYCKSGFGPAAKEVKAYWSLLEKLTDQAAATDRPYLDFFNEKTAAELRSILDLAAAKVAKAPEFLQRVNFLKAGLTAGEYTIALDNALKSKNKALFQSKLAQFRSWIKSTAMAAPFVLEPGILYRNTHLTAR